MNVNRVNSINGLQIGDEVLCKLSPDREPYDVFKVNETYKLTIFDDNDKSTWVSWGKLNNDGRWFALFDDDKINYNRFEFFYTYFYTPQEIRKLKLHELERRR